MEPVAFAIYDASTWQLWHFVAWVAGILGGFEILSIIIPLALEGRTEKIKENGKHLDVLEPVDIMCIAFNKLASTVFVYHVIRVTWFLPTVEWKLENMGVTNTLVALPTFYVVYDFFYTIFHWALHHRAIYAYVHKHHHRQKAPTRGNLDAINVHPFEFVTGEYLHLLTVYLVPCHIVAAAFFIIIGGVFASLNHTRFDVNIPGLYMVKNHDLHHRVPNSNYGQYIMLWDHIFRTFRSYDENTPGSRGKSKDLAADPLKQKAQ